MRRTRDCLACRRATSRSRSGCRATSARSSARDLLARPRRLGGARAAGRRVRGARRGAAPGGPLRGPRRRRRVRGLRHVPAARRRPELDDRDHRRRGILVRRGGVPRPRTTRRSSRRSPCSRASLSSPPGRRGSGSSPSSSPGRCSSASSAASALVIIVGPAAEAARADGARRATCPRRYGARSSALDELGWETPAVGVHARSPRCSCSAASAPRVPVGAARSPPSRSRSAAPSTSRRTALP